MSLKEGSLYKKRILKHMTSDHEEDEKGPKTRSARMTVVISVGLTVLLDVFIYCDMRLPMFQYFCHHYFFFMIFVFYAGLVLANLAIHSLFLISPDKLDVKRH